MICGFNVIVIKMDDGKDKSSNMKDQSDLSDTSSEDTVTVDKRTFWFMVAVVLVCMSILGICVALVLWKKVGLSNRCILNFDDKKVSLFSMEAMHTYVCKTVSLYMLNILKIVSV